MHECVAAIAACGVSPLVRVPDFQGWMIKRQCLLLPNIQSYAHPPSITGALDSGAHGILAPLLRTAEDAKAIVRSAKFPPHGQRGFGSPFPMEKFDPQLTSTDYLQQANSALVTAVQIETQEALDSVDEIAAVDGIDVLFIGPFDLGNNIGHPIENGQMHENLSAAIKKIFDAAIKAGKKAGIFCSNGEQARTYVEMGFHMVTVTIDFAAITTHLMNELVVAGGGQSGSVKLTGAYGK